MRRDEYENRIIDLLEGWQGGPASITLETDALTLDDGTEAIGVIFKIDTATDADGSIQVPLGTGTLSFPPGPGRLEFWVAGSMLHVRELRDALTEILDANIDPETGEPRSYIYRGIE